MDLRQLNYFVAVVENGTLSQAAESLNMTQPPLTAQIHALERDLGCPLFDRTGRRLHLNAAGERLYRKAKSILALCDEARGELVGPSDGSRADLHVGVVSSVVGTLFIGWLRDFAAIRPDLRFHLHEANTYQLMEQLRSRRMDLAIVRTPFSAPDLTSFALRSEPMLAVGTARWMSDFGLSDRSEAGGMDSTATPSLPLDALACRPLILYRRWEQILRSQFEQRGVTPDLFCINDSAVITAAMARSGLGIGLVPASSIQAADDPDGVLVSRRIDEPQLQSRICVIHRGDRSLSVQAKGFIDWLRDLRQDG